MRNEPVVFGYNGRRPADAALIWAANEAKRRGTRLVVLYAANYPGMALPPGPGLWEREPGALDAAREVTDRGVSKVVVLHPELSVSGTTVVTSPTQTVPGARSPVVVGTDGSPTASSAVAFAADTAVSNSARLEVICCTGEVPVPVVSAELLRQSAEDILGDIRDSLKETHPDLQVTTRMQEGRPEPVLLESSADAGLLVPRFPRSWRVHVDDGRLGRVRGRP